MSSSSLQSPQPKPQPLALELGGDMPCIRCGYNLRGLSIRSTCPECATPLTATLLALVDPMAHELKAVRSPKLVAIGVTLWSFAALIAAVIAWAVGIIELVSPLANSVQPGSLLRLSVVFLVSLSGIGAAAFVRPHDGLSRRTTIMSLIGLGLYIPLSLLVWREAHVAVHVIPAGQWWLSAPAGTDALCALALDSILIAILFLLRPHARLLAARSLLLRSGLVDRQTMRALAAVLGINILGNIMGFAAGHLDGEIADLTRVIGGLLITVGCLFFTMGLVGIAVDSWRIRGVVFTAPRSYSDVLTPSKDHTPAPSHHAQSTESGADRPAHP